MATKPYFSLFYQGVDISSDLDPMTTSISYTDKAHGEIDEIDVTVQDKDGLWKNDWLPEKGDTMTLTIYDGLGGELPCGSFEMDEPETSGNRSGGDIMTIRGLAAPISKPLRTQKTRAFEKQSLRQIVQKVAGENGLSVEGDIEEQNFQRVTQRRERDLEFLTRLAEDTGHYFSVRGKRAIFTSIKSVDSRAAALTISHAQLGVQLLSYRFRFQTDKTYSKAKVTAMDENQKSKIEAEVEDSDVTTGDVLNITGERVENAAQAEKLAKSRLHRKNRKSLSGSVEMVGNISAVAGVVAETKGFGRYDALLVIDSSTHKMSRSGYTTGAQLVKAKR